MKPDGSSGATKVGAAIPNIDSVKATIRTYYAATSEGIADKTKSPYITEIDKLLNDQNAYLAQNAKAAAKPAIVLDVDDTTLWNYDLEDGELHFDYDPVVQNDWVQDQKFPAVPGMAAFVDKAAKLRLHRLRRDRSHQRPGARDAGQPDQGRLRHDLHRATSLFTKWTGKPGDTQPSYITCATATRAPRSSTRPARAPTSSRCGYDDPAQRRRPVVRPEGRSRQARSSSCPTRPTTCRARTCPD